MPLSRRLGRGGRVTTCLIALTIGLSSLAACTANTEPKPQGSVDATHLLTIPREDLATFTRNFNPFSPTALPMTYQSIYEPLIINNPAQGKIVPWLATSYAWGSDNKSLTFSLQSGVKWSDGQPFTAADVVYTFQLVRKVFGDGTYPYVASVVAVSPTVVEYTLNRLYSPALVELGQQVVVPQHVWQEVTDPAKDTNPNPVGTGPYTEVGAFTTQSYNLTKNKFYWQPAKQQLAGIQMLAFSGNDGANLATIAGQTDWADQFIPDIKSTFVAKDPNNRNYWFPTINNTWQLNLNTTVAPFDDVTVRKAISMGIDRDQVAKIGESGYTHGSDCTGLTDALNSFKDQSLVASCTWTKYNVSQANQMLDNAGYAKGSDGVRSKDGHKIQFTIAVGSASTDLVQVAQIVSKNLAQIGVNATVQGQDWSQVAASYASGEFTGGIAWSENAATPYDYYRGTMSCETAKPANGAANATNFARFCDSKADALLTQLAATSDIVGQTAIAAQLETLYNEDAPTIPLFPGPMWGAYNSKYYQGWPTKADPYATLSTRSATTVLVLTNLTPRKS